MAQIITGIRRILSWAPVYDAFQNLLGASRCRKEYLSSYIRCPVAGKILDIGCGTSAILDLLPETIEYVGYDLSPGYVNAARAKYGAHGRWHNTEVSEMNVDQLGSFDIVMANGVFHHLDDVPANRLVEIAAKALKPNGRFCSLDCCLVEGQSRLARYLIKKDRGQNIRRPEQYAALVHPYFPFVETVVRHDMLRIPYTHTIIVATKGGKE